MKKLAMLLVLAMVLTCSLAYAKDKKGATLKGTYAIQGQDVCVSRWVLNPTCPTCLSNVWVTTSAVQGIATYNGDGTGTAEETFWILLQPVWAPLPNQPYYGFIFNYTMPESQTGWPKTSVVFPFNYWSGPEGYPDGFIWPQNPQMINNIWWPQQYPAEPPTDATQSFWPFGAGASQIIKIHSWIQNVDTEDANGRHRSLSGGNGQFIFGTLTGKYVVLAEKYMDSYVSADKSMIISQTAIPDSPQWTDIWKKSYVYSDAELQNKIGEQEQICQRQRYQILIKP